MKIVILKNILLSGLLTFQVVFISVKYRTLTVLICGPHQVCCGHHYRITILYAYINTNVILKIGSLMLMDC